MSDFLPIVDFLAEATTDRARAEWLSRAPMGVILRDGKDIGAILTDAGFEAGHAYFSALTAEAHKTRLPDGLLPQPVKMTTEYARLTMWNAVRTGERQI